MLGGYQHGPLYPLLRSVFLMLAAGVYLLQQVSFKYLLEPGLLLTAHHSSPGQEQEPCLSFNSVPCASRAAGSTLLSEQEGGVGVMGSQSALLFCVVLFLSK